MNIRREFVPPHESLGVTYTGSDFRLILAPAIDEPDLERDQRYVYSFTPDGRIHRVLPVPGFLRIVSGVCKRNVVSLTGVG